MERTAGMANHGCITDPVLLQYRISAELVLIQCLPSSLSMATLIAVIIKLVGFTLAF